MSPIQPDIRVFNESDCSPPLSESDFRKAAEAIARKEEKNFRFVEVVYVDEDEIVRINREHLNRDYVTDIITFRYDEEEDDEGIEGTLFCCAPRIAEQAEELDEEPEREFMRIFLHGLLHLVGYDDRTDSRKKVMTDRENYYLDLLV